MRIERQLLIHTGSGCWNLPVKVASVREIGQSTTMADGSRGASSLIEMERSI